MPAYATRLQAVLTAGHEPVHGIGVWLDRPPPERPLLAALAVFTDADPESCDWSLCRGRDVIVPGAERCDPGRLERLLRAIEAASPRRLQAWNSDGSAPRFIVLWGDAC